MGQVTNVARQQGPALGFATAGAEHCLRATWVGLKDRKHHRGRDNLSGRVCSRRAAGGAQHGPGDSRRYPARRPKAELLAILAPATPYVFSNVPGRVSPSYPIPWDRMWDQSQVSEKPLRYVDIFVRDWRRGCPPV